jgi:magnesium-transporting ATPase (P-type)
MGTVVRAGSGLVVCTGGRTEFGAIAMQLGERQPQTAFQPGLRDFSLLLVRVTAVLAGSILVLNVVLGRSLLRALGELVADDAAGECVSQPRPRSHARPFAWYSRRKPSNSRR